MPPRCNPAPAVPHAGAVVQPKPPFGGRKGPTQEIPSTGPPIPRKGCRPWPPPVIAGHVVRNRFERHPGSPHHAVREWRDVMHERQSAQDKRTSASEVPPVQLIDESFDVTHDISNPHESKRVPHADKMPAQMPQHLVALEGERYATGDLEGLRIRSLLLERHRGAPVRGKGISMNLDEDRHPTDFTTRGVEVMVAAHAIQRGGKPDHESELIENTLRSNRVGLRDEKVEIRQRPQRGLFVDLRNERWSFEDETLHAGCTEGVQDRAQRLDHDIVDPSMTGVQPEKLPLSI